MALPQPSQQSPTVRLHPLPKPQRHSHPVEPPSPHRPRLLRPTYVLTRCANHRSTLHNLGPYNPQSPHTTTDRNHPPNIPIPPLTKRAQDALDLRDPFIKEEIPNAPAAVFNYHNALKPGHRSSSAILSSEPIDETQLLDKSKRDNSKADEADESGIMVRSPARQEIQGHKRYPHKFQKVPKFNIPSPSAPLSTTDAVIPSQHRRPTKSRSHSTPPQTPSTTPPYSPLHVPLLRPSPSPPRSSNHPYQPRYPHWVHRQDFQKWWSTAREATESSKSRLHFGHYKAGASDNIISQLHATSLNTIREIGVAPDRWRQSITVLLEKVFGVRLIDKLRAICLLEADFNWLNKLIFAHRLEQHCRRHGLVPPEQFAKSRTTCEEASLVKNLVCDNSRILHNSLSITSVDMDQCFDRAHSSIAGVAARAHGVSRRSTDLMLKTMQLMQYFVKSGFGVADTPSFEGTPLALLMGLGQGSGAAPMGMRGVVTLAVNSYKTLGHGMTATMSRSQRIVLLAAIIYVDDTDLLHWGEFYGISDTTFLSRIQRAINDWGKLLQATGGSIKRAKSFYYVMSWKFIKGKPTLKSIPELHADQLTIPQPDGTSVPIPACPNDHSAKTLGTWNNPLNDGVAPLAALREKGLEWVDQLEARPLERSLTWLSLKCQKNAQWSYGLSSNYAKPSTLDATMGSIYY
ncbi:hypothetical protein ACHAXN_001984 [Cyclotella atomus]